MRRVSHIKKNFSIFFIFLLILTSAYVYTTIYTTLGYSQIKSKSVENDKYYIFVINNEKTIKLECSKDEYEKIIAEDDIGYKMTYKWTSITNKGKIIDLSFDDIIDNRN